MRAGFGVEALFSDAQALNGTARDKVLRHDFGSIFGLNISIPDCFGVNHDGGTVLALIETE